MMNSLVSSRIRRTLFGHIVSRPSSRFYLRGIAKELNLTISPLRRELLKLEQAGMLKTSEEGNLRFYQVDQTHPLFLRLKQVAASGLLEVEGTVSQPGPVASTPVQIPSEPIVAVAAVVSQPVQLVVAAPVAAAPVEAPALAAVATIEPVVATKMLVADPAKGGEPVAAKPVVMAAVSVLSHQKIERIRRATAPRVSLVSVMGASSLCVLTLAVIGMAVYLVMENRRFLVPEIAERPQTRAPAPDTASLPEAPAAPTIDLATEQPAEPAPEQAQVTVTEMRSGQWRMMTGRFGGEFAPGSREPTH